MFVAVSLHAAEQPDLQWTKTYRGSGEESHGHYIIQTADNGFIQIGETGVIEERSARILIVKVDAQGDLVWEKEWEVVKNGLDIWGEEGDWAGEDLVVTSDGSCVVATDNGGFGFVKISPAISQAAE